jgi:AmmeMemoRadiSam system protein B
MTLLRDETVPTRHPAVSGTFYPSLPGRLRADVRAYMRNAREPREAEAVLAPHAALLYGGLVAGTVFGSVVVPDTVIVLAPNHTGRSTAIEGGSILVSRAYRTPLGDVPPDLAAAEALMQRLPELLEEDLVAHAEEHAVEVLLPFLQMRNPQVRLVPIIVRWNDWARTLALATAIAELPETANALVVASSDLTHYESAEIAEEQDAAALGAILRLDGWGLLRTHVERHLTMCGVAAVACACEVARQRGATTGELLAYSHSGVINGDHERVVAYAGALLGAR